MTRASIPLLLVLAICQASFLFENDVQAADTNDVSYRLPKDVVPSVYTLSLVPDLEKYTFKGSVNIKIQAQKDTNQVILNAKQLNINSVVLVAVKENKMLTPDRWEILNKQEFLRVYFNEVLKKGLEYDLIVEFAGVLNDQKKGFYRSRYFDKDNKVKYVAVSHFEPTGARMAFPCWDEPEYKANFIISITHPKTYTAISNMPEEKSVDKDNMKVTSFRQSPKMSTYLVAFLVSDYKLKESADKKFRVFTKPQAENQTLHALNMGQLLLGKLSEYTGINYNDYMPKMDQVTLKDFTPSAMENWGLVTYRESALLAEEGATTVRSNQSITTVIAHEFAHQWFGNLVSPKWWEYIWLNEGFANYFQYFITNQIVPEWRLLETFVVDNMQGNAFVADAMEDVRPMNKYVESPSEISALFDSIAYQKGGSVIRMMSHILTQDVFQKGLQEYLKNKALSVAESKDLLAALEKQANKRWENKTFSEIMDSWVNKPGYPVVNVKRNKDGDLEVSQERFTFYESKSDTKWWVPLTYVVQSKLEDTSTTPSEWLKPDSEHSLVIKNVKKDEWFLFNNLQTGYYRVNYDEENWDRLAKYLQSKHSEIHPINRAQLIDNALNLARTNRLNYTTALSLTLYLKDEIDYVPWQATFRNLNYLHNMMRTSEEYYIFELYVKFIMKNLTKEIGYKPKENGAEKDLTKLLRVTALKWACRAGEKKCTDYVNEKFKEWLASSKPLDINLKNAILCAGLRSADEKTWNNTLVNLAKTADEDERNSLLSVLACSDSPDILKRFLQNSLQKDSPVRFASAVQNVVSEHPKGAEIALNVLIDQYDKIQQLEKPGDVINTCVDSIGGALLTQNQFIKLSKFMAKQGLKAEVLQNVVKKSTRNMEWAEHNQEMVENWLKEHEDLFNSASTAVFASFLLLLSIFITRFY